MRTNVHTLVFHLTVADSIVSFVTMPLEAGWRYTMQWQADDLSCRVLMVVRALGYYLSSAMLVMLALDRLYFHLIFEKLNYGENNAGVTVVAHPGKKARSKFSVLDRYFLLK